MSHSIKFNAKVFCRLGQSGSIFGMSLPEQVEHHNVMVLSPDMSTPAGLDRFKGLYPDRFYNVGIAEQNLIGIAAGLSAEGFKTIAVGQAAFISMRSFEQVRQYMGYMKNDMILVGISAGFGLTFFGNTHYAIEDMSILRSIPNMVVISPADAGEAVKAFEHSLLLDQPVYIRLTGGLNTPVVYKEDYEFTVGKSILLSEGEDITLFGTGSMVSRCLEAATLLKEKGIAARVIDMHTIKPLDKDVLDKYRESKMYVSVEEHNIIGGLGSAISEYLSAQRDMPVLLRLGVHDCFTMPGDYEYLLMKNRLTPELIAEDIFNRYNSL